tara:strand:- start:530 stop:1384 length:855 start_codon:yes stop_codon:yes gene_type:complete
MSSVATENNTRRKGRAPKDAAPSVTLRTPEEKQRMREQREAKLQQSYEKKRAAVEASGVEGDEIRPGDKAGQGWRYVKVDGTICKDNPLFTIHEYLASNDDYCPFSWQSLKRDLGIDLTDPRNACLLHSLSNNPVVRVTQDESGAPMVARKHELEVTSSSSLHHLFDVRLPRGLPMEGSNMTALSVTESELSGAFRGIEVHMDDLIANGKVECIMSTKPGTNREQCVFFPKPPGVQAPDFLRELWHGTKLPCEADIKKELIKAKLRTESDYRELEQRKKRRREA